jgi:hypothetical protein
MRHPLLFVVPLLLSGCIALPIPHARQISPEFYGVVTDAQTGAPVLGAELSVSIAAPRGAGNSTSTTTTSAADGKYRIKVEEHSTWYILLVGPAEGFCEGELSVSHPAYEAQTTTASQLRGAALNGTCNGYKVERNIQLKRKPVVHRAQQAHAA